MSDIHLNFILEKIAESLDISPTDYKRAVKSYEAIGTWLEDGYEKGAYPKSTKKPDIYPQGSINLGTIIRPIRDGKETDFDVDLVCQLFSPLKEATPKEIKQQVGNRLNDNETYKSKMKPEGKRCWTVEYAESEGIGFHIDILPCIPDISNFKSYYNGSIHITHKDEDTELYQWKPSNPKGFAEWFGEKNKSFIEISLKQKKLIFEKLKAQQQENLIYASVQDIPDQLVRSPLQRAIQLMKRHRDMRFNGPGKYKPISMIITFLSASLFRGENNVFDAFINIIKRLEAYAGLVSDKYFRVSEEIAPLDLIRRKPNGEWEILNPTNPGENFADRWHEDNNARAIGFFNWISRLSSDINNIPLGKGTKELSDYLKTIFGERVSITAVKNWGDWLKTQRDSGELKMQSGTGLLGSIGSITTKGHKFYGD